MLGQDSGIDHGLVLVDGQAIGHESRRQHQWDRRGGDAGHVGMAPCGCKGLVLALSTVRFNGATVNRFNFARTLSRYTRSRTTSWTLVPSVRADSTTVAPRKGIFRRSSRRPPVGFAGGGACREAVAELKRRFREPFVVDPPCTLSSHSAARDHICNSPWFQKLDAESARTKAPEIDQLLNDRYQDALTSISPRTSLFHKWRPVPVRRTSSICWPH